jgi:CxxC motif-containing protein (DUF1111 family)
MQRFRATLSVGLCALLLTVSVSAETDIGYKVKYSGGSLPNVKAGQDLKIYVDGQNVRLRSGKTGFTYIPTKSITEVSYGQEVHRRIGTAAGLAVVSFGIGALVAFSKSKKHYVGLTWDDSGNKGGLVIQADKDEYRGLIAALEGVSGKKAVDTDPPGK